MEGRTQTSRDKSKYRFVGSEALKPICSKDVIQDFLFSHGKKQTARTRIRIIKVKRIQRERERETESINSSKKEENTKTSP